MHKNEINLFCYSTIPCFLEEVQTIFSDNDDVPLPVGPLLLVVGLMHLLQAAVVASLLILPSAVAVVYLSHYQQW